MAEQLNINNLTLEDNHFEVVPDGDYHFTVDSHDVGYSTNENDPANTQVITYTLKIPFMKDGELKTATVKKDFKILKKWLWIIRQFVESVGAVPEDGKASLDLEKIDGKSGIVALTTRTSKSGTEYNSVQSFYPPSKAPAVTANDDAWNKKDDFLPVPDDEDMSFI